MQNLDSQTRPWCSYPPAVSTISPRANILSWNRHKSIVVNKIRQNVSLVGQLVGFYVYDKSRLELVCIPRGVPIEMAAGMR